MIEIFAEELFCKVLEIPETLMQNLGFGHGVKCVQNLKCKELIIFIFLV